MKILRLALAGFGPFKDQQTVDFEAFDDAGLFLITGRTGAGKSSILDAIVYALYDSVPRYDSAQQRLRSDYCAPGDPTFVELEFSIGSERYRVRRTPSYDKPKQRGEGVTTAAATAQLDHRVGDDWVGLSARAGDVGRDLDRIVGLNKNQFLQVILLAQNRFQQFLRASNDERQAVLRTLFGSQRFEQIEKNLDERRKVLEADLGGADRLLSEHTANAVRLLDLDAEAAPAAGTAASADWFDDALAGLLELHAAAETASAAADHAFDAAEIEHRSLLDLASLQKRRASAAERIAALDAEGAAIAAARTELDAARRAAPVWPLAEESASAATRLDDARSAEAAALAEWQPLDDGDTELSERIDSFSGALGALAQVLAEERTLPALESAIARQAATLADTEQRLGVSAQRADALPAELEALAVRVTDASVRAARVADAAETVARVTAAEDAAHAAARAGLALESAEGVEKAASTALLAAMVALDELLERRLTGQAVELASVLVAGEPCSVCGSVEHPSPARGTADPVTPSDVATARELVAERQAAMDAAHGTVLARSTELADARARAGERDAAQLAAELAEAEEQLALASAAGQELDDLTARRESLREELRGIDEARLVLQSERELATSELAEATSRRDAVCLRIDEQRGESATVTDRVEQITAHLAAARALEGARAAVAARESSAAQARDALERQLAAEGFATVDEVSGARRTASAITALENTVRRHDESRATASATLDEPGVADAPDEPIELEPARAARESALQQRDAARDTARALADRSRQLRAVVDAARDDRRATETKRVEFDQLRQLAGVVRGDEPNTRRMRLETFVLAAQLEEIVAAANARLGTMTSGRYALEHDDSLQYRNTKSGLGLAIRDEFTGRSRATNSLSGGETFLASLALALGLAEVVTNQAGGITLDTLFIDEGFGSLDGETLDIAMSTLDGLRSGGRTIGLISHVEGMKEQITAKLRITVTPRGSSEIEESYGIE